MVCSLLSLSALLVTPHSCLDLISVIRVHSPLSRRLLPVGELPSNRGGWFGVFSSSSGRFPKLHLYHYTPNQQPAAVGLAVS